MIARSHSARVVIIFALMLSAGLLIDRPAYPHGGGGGGMGGGSQNLGTVSSTADAALDACTGTGKALYSCVAGVLDNMGKEIASFPFDEKQTAAALRSAATRLRAAVNKVQALSAISLCQAVIAGGLRQAQTVSVNNSPLRGWGTPGGLAAVARVLAKAVAMIQARG